MQGKETTEYILEHWENDYELRDWYAVDSLDPEENRVHRLYVGDAETACAMAARRASGADLVDLEGNPCEPGEFGPAMFYRATLVDARAARDYMLCCTMHDAPDHMGELLTIKRAADELGITRQSCYELVQRGVLPSEECAGQRVGRYSVALRNAGRKLGAPFQTCELDAYLGDFRDEYDVDAIIEEVTEIDYRTGNRHWKEGVDLDEVCKRHDVSEG